MNLPFVKIFFYTAIILLSFNACKTSRQVRKSRQPQKALVVLDTMASDSSKFIAPLIQSEPTDSLVFVDSLDIVEDTIAPPIIVRKDTIAIIAVGDIMMGTNYPKAEYLPPRSWNPLDSVNHILEDADLTFGNLEGAILNEGGTPKHCKNPDACYVFRSPEYVVDYLISAGFDVMSLANNHAGDFGDFGRQNTMKILDSAGIYYAGLINKPFEIFTDQDITYGFAAFAPNTGTVSINDLENAKAITAHLDSLCDIVIISFHGGAEGKDHEYVTRDVEYYYGERRGNVYAFSHAVIDAGADVVFGHGPHVTRSIEIYKNRFIAYSLGNFCTYARFNLRGPNGMAPIVKIYTDRNGKFLYGTIIPVKQIGLGIPVVDERRSVIFKIQQLSKIDFPEMQINIDDLGNINYLDFDF